MFASFNVMRLLCALLHQLLECAGWILHKIFSCALCHTKPEPSCDAWKTFTFDGLKYVLYLISASLQRTLSAMAKPYVIMWCAILTVSFDFFFYSRFRHLSLSLSRQCNGEFSLVRCIASSRRHSCAIAWHCNAIKTSDILNMNTHRSPSHNEHNLCVRCHSPLSCVRRQAVRKTSTVFMRTLKTKRSRQCSRNEERKRSNKRERNKQK